MNAKKKGPKKGTVELFFEEFPGLRVFRDKRFTYEVIRCQCRETGRDVHRLCLLYPRGWNSYQGDRSTIMSKLLKQAMSRQKTMVSGKAVNDPAFAKAYPTLWEFLTVTVVDGKPRTKSKVTYFEDGGVWKASLRDEGMQATLWVVADSYEGLPVALEASLTSEEGNWRPWTEEWKESSKKRKKA